MIRLATRNDAEQMLAIYAPYIEQTSITFETEVPTIAAFAERIENYLTNFPWLVFEAQNKVVGYAYASRYRERVAYQWSVEVSIYVHKEFLMAGIAKQLYTALFAILKKQGFHNVYAVINLPNKPSVAFHEKMGFTWFATYEKVGYKLGKWKNVGWWRLIINDFGTKPASPIQLKEINRDDLALFFKNASA